MASLLNRHLCIKTLEQIKKIESVVLYVLHKFPEGVDYIKLFKIIYFAPKEYLATYGKVLCPDTFKARTFGPVPALSNKVIKLVEFENDDMDSYPDLRGFRTSIRVKEQMVYALTEPDMDYLSQRYDMMRHAYFQEIKHRVKMAAPDWIRLFHKQRA